MDNINECMHCNKSYQSIQALYKHRRLKHQVIHRQITKYVCYICKKECNSKQKIKSHIVGEHQPIKKQKKRLVCPFDGCEEIFTNNAPMRKHILDEHGTSIKEEIHEFLDANEFNDWKQRIEEEHKSCYVKVCGAKKSKSGEKVQYYACHRAYFPRLGHNPKKTKNCGSNKIGYACPSVMKTTTSLTPTTKIKVVFYSTHVGHSCEIGRLRIPKPDRSAIAGKISEGVTFPRILDDVRNSALERSAQEGTELKRVDLLEQKDLHNIKRDFNISYTTKLHENDAVSVRLWVERFKDGEGNTPVLYYKEQGQSDDQFGSNDFVLIIMTDYQQEILLQFGSEKICVDGTHGLNAYGFQLFTILVIDNYGSGVPVAFCISNREDVHLFELYFKCIQERTGPIHSKIFMSDDAPAFYNAWLHIMGPVDYQLLCSWHVQRNWFKNLNKISGTSSVHKRSLVFKTLKMLQTEISYEIFCDGFTKFISDLNSDPDTQPFGDYIIRHYSNRIEKWAYCYRTYLGINTNMYLEALHKKIKYTYLEGKKCKRLDKTLNALMNLLRDIYFDNKIKVAKNKVSYKILRIKESHKKSLHLSNAFTHISESEWTIASSVFPETEYLIKRVSLNCPCNCNLICDSCHTCIHNFRCTCIDNVIRFNICKHIHALVHRNQLVSNISIDNADSNIASVNLSVLQMHPSCSENIDIKSRCEMILGLSSMVTMDDVSKQYVIKHLDKVLSKMNDKKLHLLSKENININKNITPQLRFISKTKRKNHKIPSTSTAEKEIIRSSFINTSSEVLNVHDGFDHTYCSSVNKQ